MLGEIGNPACAAVAAARMPTAGSEDKSKFSLMETSLCAMIIPGETCVTRGFFRNLRNLEVRLLCLVLGKADGLYHGP